jgi:hypothetical protein
VAELNTISTKKHILFAIELLEWAKAHKSRILVWASFEIRQFVSDN